MKQIGIKLYKYINDFVPYHPLSLTPVSYSIFFDVSFSVLLLATKSRRFSVQLEACGCVRFMFLYNTLRVLSPDRQKYRPTPPRHVLKAQTKFFQYVQSLLFILQFGHPEIVTILADIGQNGTAHKDHVLSAGRILDANFEFLQFW